jgi:hypothetical protein
VAGSTNSGAVTLNLDSLGAKAVRKIVNGTDAALATGDIVAGVHYDIVYSTAANAAAGGWIITPSKLYAPDGTAALPAYTFDQDTDTGFYRIGANEVGLSLGGTLQLDFTTSAILPRTGAIALGGASNQFNGATLSQSSSLTWDPAVGAVALTQSGNTLIATSGGGAFSLIVNGLLDLSQSGAGNHGQIKFPASQDASSDANTLDDYEEGTFTPTMTFNASSTGVTYSLQNGYYVKIGQFVLAYGRVTLTSNGSGVGTARIASLPFASLNASAAQPPGKIRLIAGGSAATAVYAEVEQNATTALLLIPGAASDAAATDTNITDTFSGDFCFTYQAAA